MGHGEVGNLKSSPSHKGVVFKIMGPCGYGLYGGK